MKKNAALTLAAVLAMSVMLSACGSSSDSSADTAAAETEAEAEAAIDDGAAEAGTDVVSDVISYDDFLLADIDTLVVIETNIQATQVYKDGATSIYAQDPDGAYFIYDVECSTDDCLKMGIGTPIRVTGYKSEWAGEVEIIDAEIEFIDGDEYIADFADLTDKLGTDELEDSKNFAVKFSGMTVEPSIDMDGNEVAFLYNWDGSGEAGQNCDLYLNVSVNGETYNFVVESDLVAEGSEDYTQVTELSIGDVVDIEGFLYWYNGPNPHIMFVDVVG